uniref:(northern house mosquito) hypothetical protein n=1 Tax=Culex pipiens TaxID=7175 RepID=A0A8D8CB33_CULPI
MLLKVFFRTYFRCFSLVTALSGTVVKPLPPAWFPLATRCRDLCSTRSFTDSGETSTVGCRVPPLSWYSGVGRIENRPAATVAVDTAIAGRNSRLCTACDCDACQGCGVTTYTFSLVCGEMAILTLRQLSRPRLRNAGSIVVVRNSSGMAFVTRCSGIVLDLRM